MRSRFWSRAATTSNSTETTSTTGAWINGVMKLSAGRCCPWFRAPRYWDVPVPGVFAGHQLGDVSAGGGDAEFGESLLRLGITHHGDVGSLPVAPAGGEACVVEDPVERVVGQRFIGEFTNRVGGSHDVVEVHDDHLLAVCRVGCGWSGVVPQTAIAGLLRSGQSGVGRGWCRSRTRSR